MSMLLDPDPDPLSSTDPDPGQPNPEDPDTKHCCKHMPPNIFWNCIRGFPLFLSVVDLNVFWIPDFNPNHPLE
jgi:hypothetical protein